MALTRMTINGYGQLELNNVAFRRDGRIEAQCRLNPTDFADTYAENGMILAVDNIRRIVKLPVAGEIYPLALNYSAEHLYDERAQGLRNFRLGTEDFLPRLGYLSRGDKFTTNTLCYDGSEFDDDDALKAAVADVANTPVYGQVSALGVIQLTKTQPASGTVLLVTKPFTMPDGQYAVQLQVM